MMRMSLPVSPENCTVLGSRAKGVDDPLWAGLDFAGAEFRNWTDNPHLAVPWMHPEDQVRHRDDPDYWAIYRVRAKAEAGKKWKGRKVTAVSFEKEGTDWHITLKTTP